MNNKHAERKINKHINRLIDNVQKVDYISWKGYFHNKWI